MHGRAFFEVGRTTSRRRNSGTISIQKGGWVRLTHPHMSGYPKISRRSGASARRRSVKMPNRILSRRLSSPLTPAARVSEHVAGPGRVKSGPGAHIRAVVAPAPGTGQIPGPSRDPASRPAAATSRGTGPAVPDHWPRQHGPVAGKTVQPVRRWSWGYSWCRLGWAFAAPVITCPWPARTSCRSCRSSSIIDRRASTWGRSCGVTPPASSAPRRVSR